MIAQRERFVQEYLTDLNGTQAAIRAGYSPRNAKPYAAMLLALPDVRAAVEAAIAARTARIQLRQDRVLEELALVALSNIDDYVIAPDGRVTVRAGVDPRALRAVSRVRTKTRRLQGSVTDTVTEIQLWDKGAALATALRHLGALPLNVAHRFPDGIPAPTPQVALTADERRARLQQLLREDSPN